MLDFFEIHDDLPRGGPGSAEATRRAYAMLPNLPSTGPQPAPPRILDIGCGPGMQTIELARVSGGKVIAVDTHRPFLDRLAEQARSQSLTEQIQPVEMTMFDLRFPSASFDLLWSEGAIYIIGFETGLKAWRPLLCAGGCVAVTELTWLKSDPPAAVRTFWKEGYPGMSDLAGNRERIQRAGYKCIGDFVLPESAWWDNYYLPMEARLKRLRQKYSDPASQERIAAVQQEIDLYRKYADWYGYVFSVMQAQ